MTRFNTSVRMHIKTVFKKKTTEKLTLHLAGACSHVNMKQPQQRRTRAWTGGVSTGSQSTAEDGRAHPHVCMCARFC